MPRSAIDAGRNPTSCRITARMAKRKGERSPQQLATFRTMLGRDIAVLQLACK